MIFGDLDCLKLSDICLTGEEKPPKKISPRKLDRPRIEPGPAAVDETTEYLIIIFNPFYVIPSERI